MEWLIGCTKLMAQLLMVVAGIGLASSTIFLVLALAGLWHFRKQARALKATSALTDVHSLPFVSVLKPVHGMEPLLEQKLEGFFRQEYSAYEILFAAEQEDDPALGVVRQLVQRYPQIPVRVLITGTPPWPNPPAYKFHRMSEVAQAEILVTSDSDVIVNSKYLREVVAPFQEPGVGLVTCLYRGMNSGGFWSSLDAIGMSVEMSAGVLVANFLEGMKFGLGPTIAARKQCVTKIGGFQATGEYFSNDFALGNLVEKLGYKVVLSHHVIDHVVPPMTAAQMWTRMLRWARGTRYSRPKGHLGTAFTFSVPYGVIALLAGLAGGNPALGAALLGLSLLNRVIECLAVGWGVVRDPVALRSPWRYPIRDLLGFLVWVASYGDRRAMWRDGRYQLAKDGKIVLRQNTQ